MSRFIFMALPALMIACTSDNVIDKQENSAPTILIVSHSDGVEVQDGFVEYFRATVSDDDNEFSELTVAWYVGEEVVCDWTTASPAGDTTCEIVFQEGDNNVIVEVRDPQGAGGRAEVAVSVLPTEAPIIELLTPVSGDNYYSDGLIQFSALVADAEDEPEDLIVTWTSSVDGELSLDTSINANGEISDYTYLTEGNHALELRVEDTTGKFSTEEVVIQVGGENTIPNCAITEPSDGSAVVVGDAVTFRATVDDPDIPNNELTVEWSSNRDGVFDTTPPTSSGSASFVYNGLSSDNHTIILSVADEVGAVCTQQIILTVGNPPTVTIDEPLDGEVYSVGDTVTFRGVVQDSEDQANQIEVTWSSDIQGELLTGNANSQGVSQFTRSDLTAGVHSLSLSASDTTGLVSDDLISFRINTLPTVDLIVLSPDPVFSNDNLTATVMTSDEDGQNVTTTIAWYEDGLLTSFTGTTINSNELQVGEIWTVRVTPNDGYQDGVYVEETIVVGNTDPTISSTVISPNTNITTAQLLTCSAIGSDLDDGTLTPVYAWLSSSGASSTGATWQLNPSFVSGSDIVSCTATVTDNNGASVSSTTSVTIDNTPPVANSIGITPNAGVTTGSNLVCTAAFTDAEDGALSPTYDWSVGGSSIGSGGNYTVSSVDTDVGDTILCTASVVDSDGNQVSNTASVTVENSIPTVSNVAITPSFAITNDATLTCTANVSDVDETVQETYAWQQNGNVFANGTSVDLSNYGISPSDTITCEVSVNDSHGGSANGSDSVGIGNRAPTVTVPTIDILSPEANDTITCTASTSDDDGEVPTLSYVWMNGNNVLGNSDSLTLTSSTVGVGDLIVCTVTATDSYGAATGASALATVVNTDPAISATSIAPSSSVTVNELLTCSATATDLNDGTLIPNYIWTSSGGATANGATWQLDTSVASVGDTIACTSTVTDSNGATVTSSSSVLIQNTAPVSAGVGISPNSGWYTGTTLTCTGTFNDAEDGTITPTYDWTVNGNTVSSTATYTVDASDTDVGDSIVCIATAVDSDNQSSSDSASVTLENTAPVISVNSIASNNGLYNDSILTCSATVTDPDETLTPTYEWSVQGAPLEYVDSFDLTTAQLIPGDTVVCTASVVDSQGSSAQDSDSVVLLNRAPSSPGISMTPVQPTELVDDVTCTVDTPSTDPDGDSLTYTFTWLDGNQNTVQTGTGSSDVLPAGSVQAGSLTCEVEASDGSLTASSTTTITVQASGGPHVGLIGSPDPSTVFNSIERTYYYPNNLVNGIWHGPSNTIVTGNYCTYGYWIHDADSTYSTAPNISSPNYNRMVHTPQTELLFASLNNLCMGQFTSPSNEIYVASMDVSGNVGTFQKVVFTDGFSGECNLMSSSADQFMCFTGTVINIYNTTAGSNQLTLAQTVTPSLNSLDVCSSYCFGGTFAWDGAYFYFSNAGSGNTELSYTALNSDGTEFGVYTATGSGAINSTYFDWSVGRYTTHDGYGNRGGGTTYTPSNGSAGDDSQSYSYPSAQHSF